jgi:hypothetical protein
MDSFFRIGGLTLGVRGSDIPVTGPLAKFGVWPSRPHPSGVPPGGDAQRDRARRPIGAGETPALHADVEIDVTFDQPYAPPRGALLFDSGAVWKLFDDGDGFRIECRSELFGELPYKTAAIARDLRRVTINMRVEGLNPIEFPLDELLINSLLARNRGVELHACGVIDAGSGLLFIGNSGDGKTTTARLWQREQVEIVSDDRVVVRAENGAWTMYGTPWHGEAEICSPAHAPLRRVYVLDKSPHNGVTPLRPAEAVAHLFSCAFPPFHDRRGLETVVDTLGHLAGSVPVARLSFMNDPSTVEFVRQEAAA